MAESLVAYIGSRTTRERHARGEGLTVARFSPLTGTLQVKQVLGGLVNPSYLAVSRQHGTLYAVHGDGTEVSAFRRDPCSGHLSFLNRQSTAGHNPVHLCLSPDEQHLLVTNHQGASVVVLPISSDGALQALVQQQPFSGTPGPHRLEQTQAKPHFAAFDPSGRYLLVPDKGLDRVFSLAWDGQRLHQGPAPAVARQGAGPRHLACHPARPWVYVVNELDATVVFCDLKGDTGQLTPRQVLSCLPDDFVGDSRAAAIALDPTGQHLYVSNRGHDSIAVFTVDAQTGRLQWQGAHATQGRTPRAFSLSPCGHWLLALNEDSDSIVTLAVGRDGRLSPAGPVLACGSPVCLVFGDASES